MRQGIQSWLRSFLDFDADQKPHRTRLDREFEHLESYTVLAEDGSVRQDFRYVGEYYAPTGHAPTCAEKILRAFLFLLACALFLLSALRLDKSNRCLYVTVFQGAAVVLFVLALIFLAFHLTKPETLRDYEYRRCVRMPRRTALWLTIVLGAHAVGKLVYMLANTNEAAKNELTGALLAIGAAICAAALYGLLRRTSYRVIPPAQPEQFQQPLETERT